MKEEIKKVGYVGIFMSILVLALLVVLFKFNLYFVVPQNTYTIFHASAEFLTVLIGFFIFYYSYRAYKETGSNAIRIVGWAFLSMAVIDIFHTLAFKGFPNPFFTSGSNAGIWFWLPARFIGSLLILISAIISFSKKKITNINWFGWIVFAYVILIVPLAIYNTYNTILPAMFIEGQGLTSLKIFLEYLVMALFGLGGIIYMFVFNANRSKTLQYFIFGLIASFFSELIFTMYLSVSDVFNFFGHILKLLAYALFFYGIYLSLKEEKNE